jgi:hypothetical protein
MNKKLMNKMMRIGWITIKISFWYCVGFLSVTLFVIVVCSIVPILEMILT